MVHSLKESTAKDKVSEKLLFKLEDSLNECRESTVSSMYGSVCSLSLIVVSNNNWVVYRLSVIDCAPALKELVQITSNNWEETSFVGKKRSRTNRPQRKIVEASSSESEEEEDSDDSDDYTEDESADEKEVHTTGTKSQPKRNEEQLYFEEI